MPRSPSFLPALALLLLFASIPAGAVQALAEPSDEKGLGFEISIGYGFGYSASRFEKDAKPVPHNDGDPGYFQIVPFRARILAPWQGELSLEWGPQFFSHSLGGGSGMSRLRTTFQTAFKSLYGFGFIAESRYPLFLQELDSLYPRGTAFSAGPYWEWEGKRLNLEALAMGTYFERKTVGWDREPDLEIRLRPEVQITESGSSTGYSFIAYRHWNETGLGDDISSAAGRYTWVSGYGYLFRWTNHWGLETEMNLASSGRFIENSIGIITRINFRF